MASFTNYRNLNSTRPSQTNDENSKDLKANIRESRWIQPDQWDSPEIQEKFEKVRWSFAKKFSTFSFIFQGNIAFSDVHTMLQQLGIKVQKFELNEILEKHDRNKDGHMSKEEFEDVSRLLFMGI